MNITNLYSVAVKLYSSNKNQIDSTILKRSESFVNKDLESEDAYNLIFADGVLEIFFDAKIGGEEFAEMYGEEGDPDDDSSLTDFLYDTWIDVLKENDSSKFGAIIAKLEKIKMNGL